MRHGPQFLTHRDIAGLDHGNWYLLESRDDRTISLMSQAASYLTCDQWFLEARTVDDYQKQDVRRVAGLPARREWPGGILDALWQHLSHAPTRLDTGAACRPPRRDRAA